MDELRNEAIWLLIDEWAWAEPGTDALRVADAIDAALERLRKIEEAATVQAQCYGAYPGLHEALENGAAADGGMP